MGTPTGDGDAPVPRLEGDAGDERLAAAASPVGGECFGARSPAADVQRPPTGDVEHAPASIDRHRDLGSRSDDGQPMAALGLDGDADACLHAARLARRQADMEGALAHFERAANLEVVGVGARLALGEYLLALHLHDRAETVLQDVVRLDPRNTEAYAALAEIARRRGDRPTAAAILRAALQERPGHESLTLRLADDLIGLRRLDEAETCLAVLASSSTTSSRALRAAARVAVAAGDAARAVAHHRAAIAACPTDASGSVELALLLITYGQVDEADALLQQTREHSPQDLRCLAASRLLARRKQWGGALPNATTIAGGLPGDAPLARSLVDELRSAGRREEAEDVVQAWSAGRPADYKLLFQAGVIAGERGDHDMQLAWFCWVAAAFPDRLDSHKNVGFLLAQMGRLDEARTELLRALAIDPRNIKCLSRLASLERDADRLPVAIEILEGAVAEYPHDTALLKKLVSFLLLAQRSPRADHHLELLLAANPDDASLRELAGHVAETLGKLRTAGESYRAAIELNPGRPAGYLALARLLVADGRPGEAERVLRDAVRAAAFEPRIHLTLADIVGDREERWETCLADIDGALERSPLHVDLSLRKLHCLYRLDRPEAARRWADRLSQAHAAKGATIAEIARIAEKAQDLATACHYFSEAVVSDPQWSRALVSVGRSMVKLGRLDEAEAAIRTALAHRNEPTGLTALAEVERRRDNREHAAALVAEALAAEPDNARLRLVLAEDLYRLDRFAEAEGHLSPLMGEATAPSVLLCAARVAEAQGRNEEALRHLSAAAHAHPENTKAVLGFAAALYRFGRHKEAETALRSAVEQHPDWAAAGIQLARLLSDVGRFEEANALIDDILLRHPDEVDAWVLRSSNAGRSESTRRAEELLSAARRRLEGSSRIAVAQCELAFARGLDAAGEDLLRENERRFPDDARVRQLQLQRAIVAGRFGVVEAVLDEGRLPKAEAAYWRGQMESAHLRFPEAELVYRSALAIRPLYKAATTGLIRALVAQLKVAEARSSMATLNQLNIGIMTAKQQSLNVSQGFFGEISNDIWSNPEAMARARAALEAEEIGGLLDVVEELPEYTGAAISLVIGLRRCGALSRPMDPRDVPDETSGDNRPERIPRHCFQFWDSAELPEDVRELTSSWERLNDGWAYTLFDMRAARDFMEHNVDADTRRAFRLAHHVAQKADIFRLAILYGEGGVYADADDRCMANLEPLVRGRDMVLRHENLGSIGNNFIAVRPGHPVIGAALEGTVRAVLRGDSESIWLSTGPGMLTRAFAAYLAADRRRLSDLGGDTNLLLDWELRPFITSACRASYKSTARHWSVREFAKAG